MYCTYCRKEVNSPHRCEELIQPTAFVDFRAKLPEASMLAGYRTVGPSGYMAGAQRPADEEKEEV